MISNIRVRLTLLLAFLAVVVLPSAASAQCVTSVVLSQPLTIVGGEIRATFTNQGTCTTTVGVATYQRFGPSIDNQVLNDGITFQLAPGGTITLSAILPPCAWQADAFTGPIITSFAGGVRYGPRLLDFESGGSGACVPGCPKTQGFWKNHPEAWPVTSLTIGTVTYTQEQLLAILNTPVRGNGLISLAHQVIAADLNLLSGSTNTPAGGVALSSANTLIDGLVIPPIGSGFLDPSITSGLTSAIDQFNNSCENDH
jgi:hypothetical protein